MPEKRSAALRRRIAPFTTLKLALAEPGNSQIEIELKLAFDMNAGAGIAEQTQGISWSEIRRRQDGTEVRIEYRGLQLTNMSIWTHISDPRVLRTMLWAAALAHQPEFRAEDGLEVIGSYIDETNSDQIIDTLFQAYLSYLPPVKRALIEKKYREGKEEGAKTDGPLDPKKAATDRVNSSSGPSPDTISDSSLANSAG